MKNILDLYLKKGETTIDDIRVRIAKFTKLKMRKFNNTFVFSTPIMANSGEKNASIFACAILSPKDNLKSITKMMQSLCAMSANGAGVSIYLGNVRSVGAYANDQKAKVGGIEPLIKTIDYTTRYFNQANIRKGSAAVWLPCHHPEILSFLRFGKDAEDPERYDLTNTKTGVVLTDEFMDLVINGDKNTPNFLLRDSDDYIKKYGDHTSKRVNAYKLFKNICIARANKGYPYIYFKRKSLVECPNICTEVLLETHKTEKALCCLATINLYELVTITKDNKVKPQLLKLQNLIKSVSSYLIKIRSTGLRYIDEDTKQYYKINDNSPKKDIGIGFCGIVDLYNKMVSIGADQETIYKLFKKIVSVIEHTGKALKEDGIKNLYAIAPNTLTSVLLNNASPALSPHVSTKYINRAGVKKSIEINCNVSKDVNEYVDTLYVNKDNFLDVYNNPDSLYNKIVDLFVSVIDQGISYNTYLNLDDLNTGKITMDDYADMIINLYKRGFKTVYYHHNLKNEKTTLSCSINGGDCINCQN